MKILQCTIQKRRNKDKNEIIHIFKKIKMVLCRLKPRARPGE
ncbi:hypothetical protein LEP1GSC062_0836 [Leptospira alexanderi serovar Manhao 3 str. L 60]|uniref:Uncharacterized protein n=1 Tax=Leptospira alexanderi serovar Manhao 3 str. L 60 TaxID=1049759 RepID=V6I1A7_9LEPT|nr:hypothetical protein LEP1GSC062_0836 [Leptospira alexanderi serovar Manhao 3 str. L 60]